MPKGDRLIPRRLRQSLILLIAALSLSLPVAGIAAGQIGKDQGAGGGEGRQGEASTEGDTRSSGDQEQDEATPEDGQRARADLAISVRNEADKTELHRKFRYSFRVVNHGPETATDVRTFLTPPSTFTTNDASASCDRSRVAGAYDCVVEELPPGRDAVLTLSGEFDEPGLSSHWATVTSETVDPVLANNSTDQRVEIEGEDADDREGDVVSDFDSGSEGWSASGDVAAKSTRGSSSGDSGFLRVVDGVLGDTVYHEAPGKFEGDKASAYGGKLSFDLRQSDRDIQFEEGDVVLEGGGTTLVYDTEDNPGTGWTQYEVELSEGGWKVAGSGRSASKQQMRAVLSNLDRLAIRAEYRTGPDTDDLDNVVLETKSDESSDEKDGESADEGNDESTDEGNESAGEGNESAGEGNESAGEGNDESPASDQPSE